MPAQLRFKPKQKAYWLTLPKKITVSGPQKERFAVTYNRDKHFSVLFENMINTGGAHPNTLRNSAIYDMTTGKSLTLSDILNGD